MAFNRKYILRVLLLLVASAQTGWAQRVKVRMNNAQSYEFNLPDVESIVFDEGGPAVGRQFVDLELPSGTLWATCNVGANSPEEYGSYYAWGETKQKNVFNWGTYKLCGGTQQTMKKYCVDSRYGTVDDLLSLEAEDDAATANWGEEWQMPSQEQFQELFNAYFTSWELTTQNDVKGIKVTSRMNGNSIFLPAAGGFCTNDYYGAEFTGAGSNGIYWSRSLYQNACYGAHYLAFYSGNVNTTSYTYRYFGCSIRPVRGKVQLATSITLPPYLSLQLNETKLLSPTILPADASSHDVTWESSDKYVAEVTQNGRVIAKGKGTCIVTCRAMYGSDVSAECQVTVGGAPTHGTVHGHEWVDLMLPSQTLWATTNVGASSPDRNGFYFAWGETETKDDYSWQTYQYCNGTRESLTKYCVHSKYGQDGFTDNKKLLETGDDAASFNWCTCWQMPTGDQMSELISDKNTTVKWTTMNGVNGIRITSKMNGESIFLPAAGSFNGTKNSIVGSQGLYWTRSVSSTYSYDASSLYFTSGNKFGQTTGRCNGFSVRPVLVPGSLEPVRLVASIELSTSTLSLKSGYKKTLVATVLPANADNKTLAWESSNADVADVTGNGTVIANANGTCVITCRATDGSDVSAVCQVTVSGSNTQDGDYVDLGLPSGTLWATHNIGANAPEEFGDYFAWGETTPKEKYNWITYEYGNKASWAVDWRVIKYCTHANDGVVDNKTELEPEDDAATVNWGSEWQTPSIEQLQELIDSRYTTVTDEIVNTVICRKVTSKANGKSIILPCSGWMVGTELDGAEQEGGCYWSRFLDQEASLFARILFIDGNNKGDGYIARSSGCAVRPVRKN